MSRAVARNAPPVSFCDDPGRWPDAELRDDAPPHARQARLLAVALEGERAGRGLSERGLATLLGVPNNTLSKLLRGNGYPDFVTLARVAEALGRRILSDPGPASGDEDRG